MQLQLSLAVANRLHETILVRGEPIDALEATSLLTASSGCPASLCRDILSILVSQDRRFCLVDTDLGLEAGRGGEDVASAPEAPPRVSLRHWEPYDPDLAEVPFVALDLETTGARPGAGKITEIGMVRFEGFREIGRLSSLVNPMRPIPRMITAITGISQKMVANAPRIEELMPDILAFLEGAVVVAHNAAFDVGFLNYELRRLRSRELGDGAIDTLMLSRALAPGLPNYKLGTVAEALGSPVSACHRALADAEAAGYVFLTLMARLREQGVTRLSEARAYTVASTRAATEKLALTRDIPDGPGIYTFVDGGERVVFVGRADRLREEVRAHFVGRPPTARKMRQAVRAVDRIDWEDTCTSLEAAIREQQLILEHRPACNQHGVRPESYAYLKVRDSGPGLCLYVSNRPPNSLCGDPGGRKKGHSPLALGPFRQRARLTAALDLLQRSYPIRRCPRHPEERPCARGLAGECLRPCLGDIAVREEHDALVRHLIDWLIGRSNGEGLDPVQRAGDLAWQLSHSQKHDDAERTREALDSLIGIRRSYHALAEACSLRFATLSKVDSNGDSPTIRLSVVWNGRLQTPVSLGATTTEADITRALAGCLASCQVDPHSTVPVAVCQHEVDELLAVRRWLKEPDRPLTIQLTKAGTTRARLDIWKSQLANATLRMFEESAP